MAYVISWEERGVYCQFNGIVSGNELMQCNNEIYGAPNFDNMRYQIFDMLNVEQFSITERAVKEIAACDCAAALTNTDVKCALVATDTVAHTLSKVYQDTISQSPWEGRSFKTIEEARHWLK